MIKSNEKFTQRAEQAIEQARAAAGDLGHGYVGTEHLLLGILASDSITIFAITGTGQFFTRAE